MSFGQGPFGIVVFGAVATPPASQALSTLSSSRQIDGVTRRYVLNTEGGFAPMGDTAQRVLLAVSTAVGADPPLLSPANNAEVEARIRDALASLTTGPEPVIRIVSIEVARTAPGVLSRSVTFVDLTRGTTSTVTASA